MSSLIDSLRRRKVGQWALAYLAGAVFVVQLMDGLEGPLGLSRELQQAVLVLMVVGFPIALVVAWYHGEGGEQGISGFELLLIAGFLVAGGFGLGIVDWEDPVGDLDPNRIAILYFSDESGTGELAALTTGLTANLIAELDQVPALDVISSNGVKRYRDQPIPPEQIARELSAGSLVAGSVQRFADTVAVFVQLIDGSSGNTLDTRRITRAYTDALSLQDDLAAEVAGSLRRRLGREVRIRQLSARARNADAWYSVQQATNVRDDARQLRAFGDSVSIAAAYRQLDRADSLLREAQASDPRWVEPLLLRGWVLIDRIGLPYTGQPEAVRGMAEKGIALAEQALAMAPGDQARALELRGLHRFHLVRATSSPTTAEAQLSLSESDLRQAVNLDASLASAWSALSGVLWSTGQFAEATLAGRKALEADAYLEDAEEAISRLFLAYLQTGEYRDAAAWCERGQRDFPDDWRFVECHLTLMAFARNGDIPDVQRAHRLYSQLTEMSPPEVRDARLGDRLIRLTAVLARAGAVDSALATLESVREVRLSIPEHTAAFLHEEAYIRLLLGEEDRAFALLAEYVEQSPQYRAYLAQDVSFMDLRGDPRFQQLIRPE